MSDRPDAHSALLSRRQWGLLAATPLVAAKLPAAARQVEGAEKQSLVGARVHIVRDFGAAGDGATLDTTARGASEKSVTLRA